MNLKFDIDRDKTVPTRFMPKQIRPEYELPNEVLEFMMKNSRRSK